MQLVVLASEIQKQELGENASDQIVWVENEQQFRQYPSADALLDLTYVNTPKRNALLSELLPKPVVVNSVTDTLREIHSAFIRVNAWNTFLASPMLEAACTSKEEKAKLEEVFSLLQKKIEWLPDEPGFVTARVVSMIINEAYLALEEGVSTKDEINTAMKLGTNYPYGPFEWAEKIGLQNIAALLRKLSVVHQRYIPSAWLMQEAEKAT